MIFRCSCLSLALRYLDLVPYYQHFFLRKKAINCILDDCLQSWDILHLCCTAFVIARCPSIRQHHWIASLPARLLFAAFYICYRLGSRAKVWGLGAGQIRRLLPFALVHLLRFAQLPARPVLFPLLWKANQAIWLP